MNVSLLSHSAHATHCTRCSTLLHSLTVTASFYSTQHSIRSTTPHARQLLHFFHPYFYSFHYSLHITYTAHFIPLHSVHSVYSMLHSVRSLNFFIALSSPLFLLHRLHSLQFTIFTLFHMLHSNRTTPPTLLNSLYPLHTAQNHPLIIRAPLSPLTLLNPFTSIILPSHSFIAFETTRGRFFFSLLH
jgi:hypothetical protein